MEYKAFKSLHTLFSEKGHEIMIAGGAVRDYLRNVEPNDIDFATTATPNDMKVLLFHSDWTVIETGIEHGTLTLHHHFHGDFEVTTLRNDIDCDGRHAEVKFTQSFKEDAARRDFTINAMFMDMDGKIYDFFGGKEDLQNSVVRFVGDAELRIQEDALRILRFFRMICKFNKKADMDLDSQKAIVDNVVLIRHISVERIWQEFKKVCKDNPENVTKYLCYLEMYGISDVIDFPVTRRYTIKNLDIEMISKFPECAIATVFEDIQTAEKFCEHYKLSTKERSNIMFFIKHAKDTRFEDFDIRCVEDLINDNCDKEQIKIVACYHRNSFLHSSIDDIQYTEFPVSGKDLITAGIEPGPEMGDILSNLRDDWKQSRYTKTKEELLKCLAQ